MITASIYCNAINSVINQIKFLNDHYLAVISLIFKDVMAKLFKLVFYERGMSWKKLDGMQSQIICGLSADTNRYSLSFRMACNGINHMSWNKK